MSEQAKRGKQASVDGFAHEHIAIGILMKIYQNVSQVDLPHSPYDLIIVKKDEEGHEDVIRAQVKTSKKSIPFHSGGRGGVDRKYISGVKEYVQNTKISDVVIGVNPLDERTFDLYFVPTILVEKLGTKSLSIKKAVLLKNNYEILDNCKNPEFVISKAIEFGLLAAED